MGHAYTVLDTYELENDTQLVKVRNPWGSANYNGPWSVKSREWSTATPDEVEALKGDSKDGIFWIDFATYIENFSFTMINYSVENWASARFLMVDDQTKVAGIEKSCGKTCTRHTFTLESTEEQTVYITGHTWQERSYGKMHQKEMTEEAFETGPVHLIQVIDSLGNKQETKFGYGDGALEEAWILGAGEVFTINIEWNFSSGDFAPDWGLTVYGDSNVHDSLILTHSKGLRSYQWKTIERQEPIEKEDILKDLQIFQNFF